MALKTTLVIMDFISAALVNDLARLIQPFIRSSYNKTKKKKKEKVRSICSKP